MGSIQWAELCDHVLIDRFGKVSIIGIFDKIMAGSFPALHPDLWVVAKFQGMPGEKARMEIDFVDPDGKIIGHAGPVEGGISEAGTALLAARVLRPVFERPGRYEVKIRPSVGQPAGLPLNVQQRPVPPQSKG